MKPTKFLSIFLMLALMLATAVSATMTAVTLNYPASNTQTNDATIIFQATVTYSAPTNVTNVTFWDSNTKLATNSTVNGSSGVFTFSIARSSLAEGSHSIKAEARNDSDVECNACQINSSAVSFIVDTTAPTCRMMVALGTVKFGSVQTIDCSTGSGTTDTNTINTSSYNLFVTSSLDVTTNNTGSAQYDFSGDVHSAVGEYTAGCTVRDNAGNLGTCTTETYSVSNNKNEVDKAVAAKKELPAKKSNSITIGITAVALFIIAGLGILLAMNSSKKPKRRK